ncbi:MAG: hypothetical protein SVP26_04085 [Chloroflexota bacterium]|nr:hypothetical protein [Chloroflexota bacterium]
MPMVRRVLMALVVLSGVTAIVGFFLPWIDASGGAAASAHVSGWQVYSHYGRVVSLIVPCGVAVAVLFGLAAALFPGLESVKGVVLTGAVAAALVAGGVYAGVIYAPTHVTAYLGETWTLLEVGYGLLVSLIGAGVAWLLTVVALIP